MDKHSCPALDTRLFSPGDRVLAAVSGGADSLALLHLLASRRAELGIGLVAAHVHHGIRGSEADADLDYVRSRCTEWGVPLAVEHADVPALSRRLRISLEEAGRAARYAAFGRLASAHGCGKVATAHHADDQAETVLLNLFRGAGIDGMAGIPVRRPLSPGSGEGGSARDTPQAIEIVRPLLGVWKAELHAYCSGLGLWPREDPANQDLRYRRNQVRLEVLPFLERHDPAIREHLVRLAAQAREEQDLLRPEAAALLSRARRPGPGLRLDTSVLAGAPVALLRRALRLALRELAGYALELDAALVERLVRLSRGERTTALDLPGTPCRARREKEVLVLEALPPPPAARPGPVPVAVPGVTEAPGFGLRLEVEAVPPPDDPRMPPERAVLDADRVELPLELRAPREGDRFRPLGAPGTRLLSDVFTDRKIPRSRRGSWPVLADRKGIVWVFGVAVTERVRVTSETRRCLAIAGRWIEPDMV